MTKAESLKPARLQALSELHNSALVHTCDLGHRKCSDRPNGPCADQAADLYKSYCASLHTLMKKEYQAELGTYRSPAFAQDPDHPQQRTESRESATNQLTLF